MRCSGDALLGVKPTHEQTYDVEQARATCRVETPSLYAFSNLPCRVVTHISGIVHNRLTDGLGGKMRAPVPGEEWTEELKDVEDVFVEWSGLYDTECERVARHDPSMCPCGVK